MIQKGRFEMENKLYDIVIVGGGPAGFTAALYGARAGHSVLVLEKMVPGGQMAMTENIENYPGFERIDGFTLAEKMKSAAEAAGAQTHMAEVTAMSLNGKEKTITTTEGEVKARAVVLAMGAVPRTMGVAEEEEMRGRGVSYCATCDGNFFRGKTVAVVGGGNSAAEDALYLSKLCKQVYVIHRRDTLRATRTEASRLEQAENVTFLWNKQVIALQHDFKLTGALLRDTQTGETSEIACDGLFVAIGRKPDTALVQDQLECTPEGYLVADETTRTSVPGVFAAGDVRQKPLRQIVTAAADGAVAAHFAQQYLEETAEA